MPNLPLPTLVPDDPENLLSSEARQRIARAFLEYDLILKRALAESEMHRRAQSDRGAEAERSVEAQVYIDLTRARMGACRCVLKAEAEEYGKLNLPGARFREIMHQRIDEMTYSLELTALDGNALASEFLWFDPAVATVPRRVAGLVDQRSITNPAAAGRVKEYMKRHALTATGFATSKGENRIDERTVRRLCKFGTATPATWAEVAGLMGLEPSELLKN
jgi:hypothetical protein